MSGGEFPASGDVTSARDWSAPLPAGLTCHLFARAALPGHRDGLYRLATGEDHIHADGFGGGARGEDFILARGMLRAILVERFGRSTGAQRIVQGRGGRPELAGASGVGFSVSRSRQVLGIAVNAKGAVGLDVEEIGGPDGEPAGLSADEWHVLAALPAELKGRAALLAWTLKEAKAKRDGAELHIGPEAIQAGAALRWVGGEAVRETNVRLAFLRLDAISLAASIAF